MLKLMKRFKMTMTLLTLIAAFVLAGFGVGAAAADPPRYVFLFIGDGMSFPQIMALGAYDGTVDKKFVGTLEKPTPENPPQAELPSFVAFPVNGAVTTPDASKFITDSASAATAMACGVKTLDGMIGLDPAGKKHENMAERFKNKLGYKVGVITSMSLDHATPAAFYGHLPSRSDYYGLSMELIASGFDFFGGGGLQYPTGAKKDQPDFFELAQKAGYNIVDTVAGIEALSGKSGKTIAINPVLDQWACMNYAIDVKNPAELRLKDFVRKGIEVLDNDKGFFLMVEGGKIDWAAHANDAYTTILDVKELDESIKVAVEFAKKHPEETLIVVVGDHETGGLTVGFGGLNFDTYLTRLQKQTMSYQFFTDDYVEKYRQDQPAFEEAMKDVEKCFGLIMPDSPAAQAASDPGLILSAREVTMLKEAYASSLTPRKQRPDHKTYDYYAKYTMYTYEPFTMVITQILSNKAGLGWTSGAHTALPVSIHALGNGAETFRGFYDNTEVFHRMMNVANIQ